MATLGVTKPANRLLHAIADGKQVAESSFPLETVA